MKGFGALSIWTSVIYLISAHPADDKTVSIGAPECQIKNDELQCNYEGLSQSVAFLDNLIESSVKSVTIQAARKLIITEPICRNLKLCDIAEVHITSVNSSPLTQCGEDIELSVSDTVLPRIPSGVNQLYLTSTAVDNFFSDGSLHNVNVNHSRIKLLDLRLSSQCNTYLVFNNSSVETLQNLEVGPNSHVLLMDSEFDMLRSKTSTGSTMMTRNSSLTLESFQGNMNITVSGELEGYACRDTQNISEIILKNSRKCLQSYNYFSVYVTFLVLFIIMTSLFFITLVLKQRVRYNEDFKGNTKHTASIPVEETNGNASVQPLLQDDVDKGISSIVTDPLEDNLVKSAEITKALYLEDIEDINNQMKVEIDIQKREDFNDFVRENKKRLELEEFQKKSNAKLDKHTAMIDRMNQAVRDLIEEQYKLGYLELKNSRTDIIIKHNQQIIECNESYFEDMAEIIRTSITTWVNELNKDQTVTPIILAEYIRIILSDLMLSISQFTSKLQKQLVESKADYEKKIKDLDKDYKARREEIDAIANEKLKLISGLENADSKAFGKTKAFRLSSLQEEIAVATQTRQHKEADLEFTEARRKISLQETIIRHQEEYQRHLEVIVATLTNMRKSFLSPFRSSNQQDFYYVHGDNQETAEKSIQSCSCTSSIDEASSLSVNSLENEIR